LSEQYANLNDLFPELLGPTLPLLITIIAQLESIIPLQDDVNFDPNIADEIELIEKVIKSAQELATISTTGLQNTSLLYISSSTSTIDTFWSVNNYSQRIASNFTETALTLWPSSYILSNCIWTASKLEKRRHESNNNNHILSNAPEINSVKNLIVENKHLFNKNLSSGFSLHQLLTNKKPIYYQNSNLVKNNDNNTTTPIKFHPTVTKILVSQDIPCPKSTSEVNFLEIGCGSAALPTIVTARLSHDYLVTHNTGGNFNIHYSDMNPEILTIAHASILASIKTNSKDDCDIHSILNKPQPTVASNHLPETIQIQSNSMDSTPQTLNISPLMLNWLDEINMEELNEIVGSQFTQSSSTGTTNSIHLVEYFESCLSHDNPSLWLKLQNNLEQSPSRKLIKSYGLSELFQQAHSDLVKYLDQYRSNPPIGVALSEGEPEAVEVRTIPTNSQLQYDVVYCSDIVYDSWHALCVPFVCRNRVKSLTGKVFITIGNFIRCQGGLQLIQLVLFVMYLLGFVCIDFIEPSFRYHPNQLGFGWNNTETDSTIDSINSDQCITSPEFSFVFVLIPPESE
jgi:hypothetical protein